MKTPAHHQAKARHFPCGIPPPTRSPPYLPGSGLPAGPCPEKVTFPIGWFDVLPSCRHFTRHAGILPVIPAKAGI